MFPIHESIIKRSFTPSNNHKQVSHRTQNISSRNPFVWYDKNIACFVRISLTLINYDWNCNAHVPHVIRLAFAKTLLRLSQENPKAARLNGTS